MTGTTGTKTALFLQGIELLETSYLHKPVLDSQHTSSVQQRVRGLPPRKASATVQPQLSAAASAIEVLNIETVATVAVVIQDIAIWWGLLSHDL